MTKKKIIEGLKFTIEMFLIDPNTGEVLTEPRNELDKITVESCRCAIEALEQEPCEDCISRKSLIAKAHHEAEAMGEPFHKTFGLLVEFVAEKEPSVPSVQPIRANGKWIDDCGELKCSECGAIFGELYEMYNRKADNYCPCCGADMRKGENNEKEKTD